MQNIHYKIGSIIAYVKHQYDHKRQSPQNDCAFCRRISCIEERLNMIEVQGRALLAPEGQGGVDVPQVAQHLLAVSCCVSCHHLVLPSNLHVTQTIMQWLHQDMHFWH